MSKKRRKSCKKTSQRQRKHSGRKPSEFGIPPISPRLVEDAIRQMLQSSRMVDDDDDAALAEARDLVAQAYDADNYDDRLDLASKAIEVCPGCADAYVCMAELAPSPKEAVGMYQLGMEAGERALGGPESLGEYEGHFWGILDTRPYMRARLGLAQCQWTLGRRDEAIDHCRDLLRLNPNDNQGVRYVLCSYYCNLRRYEDLQQLLDEYKQDCSAEWLFSLALAAFCQEGDVDKSRRLLREAHDANPHVAAYLLGREQVPDELPSFVEVGAQTEAIAYASNFLTGWRAAAGSIRWVRRTLKLKASVAPPVRQPSWESLKHSISDLPLAEGEVWQFDVRRTAAGVPPGTDMERPWTVIVTCPDIDRIVALDTLEDDVKPTPNQLLADLVKAMRSPHDSEPRRPEYVQVRLKTVFDQWESKLQQIGVQCKRCENLDYIDLMIERLENMSSVPQLTADELASRVSELAELPQDVAEVWQADIRKLSAWILEEGEPVRPCAALVTNRTDELILAQNLGIDEPNVDSLRQVVMSAMLGPLVGDPHLPGTIQFASQQHCDELLPLLEPLGVACTVCDQLDQLDFLLGEVEQSIANPDERAALIDTPGVTLDHVRGVFEAAAEYYENAPWVDVPGAIPIRVRCERFQTPTWYAIVMGQSGMTLGLALYEDLDVLRAILLGEEDAERRNSALSILYGERFDIAVRDLDAAEQKGWSVAGPDAYPMILRVNPGMAVRSPLAWELELAEACLRAIPTFLKQDTTAPMQLSVSTVAGELNLQLSWGE